MTMVISSLTLESSRVDFNLNRGPAARHGPEVRTAAQQSRALRNAGETKTSTVVVRVDRFWGETRPVVVNRQDQGLMIPLDLDHGLSSTRMFQDIVYALLNNAVEVDFGVVPKSAIDVVDLDPEHGCGRC